MAEGVGDEDGEKIYTIDDFADRTTRSSCWVAIGDHVYDVTNFLEEHPGGDDIILEEAAGTDATEKFEEIGHSPAARAMLEKYVVGRFKDTGAPKPKRAQKKMSIQPSQSTGFMKVVQILLPLLLVALAVALQYFSSKKK
eukprot:evm.model.scf_1626.3 EVM.evm.TU.scf_1626.3   scf_1626:21787-23533(-)